MNTCDEYFDHDPAFVWKPEKGMGFYPVQPSDEPYDDGYFAKYQAYANTAMGKDLTAARVKFVKTFWSGPVLDFGIGSGSFVEAHQNAKGYDINPAAIDWLEERNLYECPFDNQQHAICFWDSLEHVEDPADTLRRAGLWAFVSLPIFRCAGHVMKSKHFRKDEHRWYWTEDGFMRWANHNGFMVKAHTMFERDLGREDIHTFALERLA